MLEVFVAFTQGTVLNDLDRTLEAWNLAGLEPISVLCKMEKFEIHRRVTAENIAQRDYVLADLMNEPIEKDFGELAEKLMAEHTDVGLLGAWRMGQTAKELPNGVVICRKGIVEKWPEPHSATSTYIQEHAEAYQLVGWNVFLSNQIHYRRIPLSGQPAAL